MTMEIEDFKKQAKKILVEHGYHAPMIFINRGYDIVPFLLKWANDEDKYRSIPLIKQVIKTCAVSYIFIMDACMRKISVKNKDFFEQNYETEKPSLYTENMRTECLIVQERKRTGENKIYLIQYKKTPDGIEFLEEELLENNEMKGALIDFYN